MEKSPVMEPDHSAAHALYAAPRVTTLAVAPGETGRLVSVLGPVLAAGRTFYCLDGGNVFNPLPVAAELRRRGFPPGPILAGRIFVSRAFTCHQLAGAVTELLAPLARRRPVPFAMILGLERLFLDEDIPLFERSHLFGRILKEACALRQSGLPLLITCDAGPDNPWISRLKRETHFLPTLHRPLPS